MRRIIFLGFAFGVGSLIGIAPALASHQYWAVDDSCGTGGSTYFYPGGAASGWQVHSGNGYQGVCHMWTWPTCGNCAARRARPGGPGRDRGIDRL